MYEGTATKVKEVFAQYDVATKQNCAGMRALIMGKLYRRMVNGSSTLSEMLLRIETSLQPLQE